MRILSWIENERLYKLVNKLLATAKFAKQKAINELGDNVMDPFSALFEISGFKMSYDEWLLSEQARQAQKTLTNNIGEFHQSILGSCNGWEDLGKGNIVDLLNSNNKIIAEVKNKHNTVSGGKLSDLYWSLESIVMNKTSIYKGFTAYYVTIIPKNASRFNKEFTPSDKEKGQKCPNNQLIRQIDGASFYHLVTGELNALEQLFDVLPFVISDITGITIPLDNVKTIFNLAYMKNL